MPEIIEQNQAISKLLLFDSIGQGHLDIEMLQTRPNHRIDVDGRFALLAPLQIRKAWMYSNRLLCFETKCLEKYSKEG